MLQGTQRRGIYSKLGLQRVFLNYLVHGVSKDEWTLNQEDGTEGVPVSGGNGRPHRLRAKCRLGPLRELGLKCASRAAIPLDSERAWEAG